MAFDGSCVAALCAEFNKEILDGRIIKIAQPEKDELLLTIKKEGDQKRLLISANPSLPMCYLTDVNKTAPLNAPSFCMLLRKHIQNGKIIKISQPSLERIIDIEIEHYNEMGDLCHKILTIELMGKHSNIIFRDGEKILDSIKHVNALVSSIREVLPGRTYFIPFEDEKLNPLSFDTCSEEIEFENIALSKFFSAKFTGISTILAQEICAKADIDSDRSASTLDKEETKRLMSTFNEYMQIIKSNLFEPNIVYDGDEPIFFAPFIFSIYSNLKTVKYESISALLFDYYSKRQSFTSLRQKTSDLRGILQTLLAKDYKKYDLQLKQIEDTKKKDKYQLYGELITAYGYNVPEGSKSMNAVNYHTNEEITIPLDPTISPIDNGKKYFEKYSKLKRTFDSLSEIIKDTKDEIDHLESIQASLDTAQNEADISDIKKEMVESGYIKQKGMLGKNSPKKAIKSSPMHFVSSDGLDIYVGKNNYQNEYVSFKLAGNDDWWFHAKKIPGSHVILKTNGQKPSDKAVEEAASLAAHFSKAGNSAQVEIDYVQKKYLKKPAGGKLGLVIYHTNYSLLANTNIDSIKNID